MIECAATANGRLLGMSNAFSSISDDQVQQIRNLRARGWTYQAIAKEVGCCLAYAQKVVAGALRGHHPARTLHRLTVDDLPQVAALHAQGHGYEAIAKLLGSTRSSTRLVLLDVKRQKVGA